MRNLKRIIPLIIIAVMIAAVVQAKFDRAEDAIRYRQAVMVLIGQHFGRMAEVVKERQPFDQSAFIEETAVLETLAKLPWEAFLYPGGDRGKTQLDAKAFERQDDFMKAAREFEAQTAGLAAAARKGDLGAIKAQFGAVAQTCGRCHDSYRSR
jgi:cytochrome c556